MQVLAIAEVVAQFVVGGAEARRPLKGTEAPHRGVALFDAPVILLHAVIQVTVRAVWSCPVFMDG